MSQTSYPQSPQSIIDAIDVNTHYDSQSVQDILEREDESPEVLINPTAREITGSRVVAYHPHPTTDTTAAKLGMRRPSMISENLDCSLADVRELMVKEPYEFWKWINFVTTISGIKVGWWHDRSRPLIRYLLAELLLAIVVVFAQIPETISFSMIAHMDPSMGLHGAWIIGLVTAILGGRPGMICGTTASVSAVTGALMVNEVKPHLVWPIIITAGVCLITFSFLNLSFIIRFISKNVMIGFCNGLGILIALSQLHMFHAPDGNYVEGEQGVHMIIMCLISMIAFQFWPKVPVASRVIPAAFIGVAVAVLYETLIVQLWRGCRTTTVGDIGSVNLDFKFPRLFWTYPSSVAIFDYTARDYGQILSYGVSFFLVMVLESLMTINVLDGKYDQVSNGDQTIFAIGVANIISGLFGGLGGNTMIGLSNLLANGGGCGKEAPVICAILVLLVVTCIPWLLNIFPTAGLAGIMFIVALHTFSFDSMIMIVCSFMPQKIIDKNPRLARAIPTIDALILLSVTLIVPTMGLDVGIITGVVISSFCFVDKIFRQMRIFKHIATREKIGKVAVYDIFGPLFFSSTATLHRSFDFEEDPNIVIIRMTNSNIMDYSAMETLSSIKQCYENQGKRLIVKNLKKECEIKLLRSQARLEWDKDRDHETHEVNIPRLLNFGDEMPDLPGLNRPHTSSQEEPHHSSVLIKPVKEDVICSSQRMEEGSRRTV